MNQLLLFISIVFILALFAIRISHKYGISALLLFFILGIGAASLGLDFQNYDFMERYASFDFIVAKLVRNGKTIVPHGNTVLEKGDVAVIGGKSHFDEVGGNLEEFTIRKHHPWEGKRIMDLNFKPSELILIVQRDQNILVPSGRTVLCAGDKVVYTDNEDEIFDDEGRDISAEGKGE